MSFCLHLLEQMSLIDLPGMREGFDLQGVGLPFYSASSNEAGNREFSKQWAGLLLGIANHSFCMIFHCRLYAQVNSLSYSRETGHYFYLPSRFYFLFHFLEDNSILFAFLNIVLNSLLLLIKQACF